MGDESRYADHIRQLSKDDWEEIYKKAVYCAFKQIKSKALEGIDAEDMAQKAMMDILNGTRNANHEKVSLITLILNTVKSNISHLFNKQSRVGHIGSADGEPSPFEQPNDFEDCRPHLVPEPQSIEKKLIDEEVVERAKAMLRGDEKLLKVIDLYLDNPGIKPKEIAKELGIKVSDVNNIKKRLSRRLKAIKDGFKKK